MQSQKKFSRIVIKIGSSLISSKKNIIALTHLKKLAAQISLLVKAGSEVIVVSSGAVACGMSLLKIKSRPKNITNLQACASIGQNELMGIYRRFFGRILCAQLLLTWEDFEDRNRYINARNTIDRLLKSKVIPIINENDTVSTQEIKFGDNDKLSALVANLMGADLLIILSDVDGLYRLPRKEVIAVVDEITPEIRRLCRKTNNKACVGGMPAKIEAIKSAASLGIPCVIANGKEADIISRIASGERIGTLFLPKKADYKARQRWIACGVRAKGMLVVDAGAKEALIKNNKSLLSVGITDIKGNFEKADIVSVSGTDLNEFARGQVNFSSDELLAHKSQRLGQEVIHKDNLVII